jgi:hypothetical protein
MLRDFQNRPRLDDRVSPGFADPDWRPRVNEKVTNRYSVPPEHADRTLTLASDEGRCARATRA